MANSVRVSKLIYNAGMYWYILVYTSIYYKLYIQYKLVQVYTSILEVYPYSYVLFTGFRGTHRDVPPEVETQTGQKQDKGDPNPCPEDDADLMRPDAEEMEEAITNFMDDMMKQEHGCFRHIHTFLSKLPVHVHTKCRDMTHEIAIEGGFLQDMSEDERKRFTPTKLMLYKHALEY